MKKKKIIYANHKTADIPSLLAMVLTIQTAIDFIAVAY